MDGENLKRIKANFSYIVENIADIRVICDHLISKDVISREEYEEIVQLPLTSSDRVRQLLIILTKKDGTQVFGIFCDTLRHCNCGYIADSLLTCDISMVSDDPTDFFDEVDSRRLNKDKLINTLSNQTDHLMSECKQYRLEIEKLKEEKKILEQNQVHLEALKKCGFTDETLLTFADMFLFVKSEKSPVPYFSSSSLSPEASVVCRLSVDIVHYIAAIHSKNEQNKPFSVHAQLMRQKVVAAHEKYGEVFDRALQALNFTEINGYKSFTIVANEMFKNGENNWGRILAWFAFTSYLVKGFPAGSFSQQALDLYGTYSWHFLDQHQSKWLNEVGGWGYFLTFLEKSKVLCQLS